VCGNGGVPIDVGEEIFAGGQRMEVGRKRRRERHMDYRKSAVTKRMYRLYVLGSVEARPSSRRGDLKRSEKRKNERYKWEGKPNRGDKSLVGKKILFNKKTTSSRESLEKKKQREG